MNSSVVRDKALNTFCNEEKKYPRSDVDSVTDVDGKTLSNIVKEGIAVVTYVAGFD